MELNVHVNSRQVAGQRYLSHFANVDTAMSDGITHLKTVILRKVTQNFRTRVWVMLGT